MKIGIDARLYGAGKNRGIGRYIAELLNRLDTADKDNQYVVFLRHDNFDLYNPPASNISKIKVDIPWYSWQEQLIFPWFLYKQNFDFIHFMHFNVPLLYWHPFILTIHDLIMTHYSDDRSTTKSKWIYYIKIKIARLLVYISAHRAKKVLCPSLYTETDLIRLLGIAAKKIKVTPEAVNQINVLKSQTKLYKKYQPYFLYVGAAYPHKNLEFMIKGFQKFNTNKNYNLLCVGREDFFYKALSEKNKFEKNLVFLGEVTDNELVELYEEAVAFVYPSLIEGFGLPPLEAMAVGVPVIASSASCLPEVLGDAAYYINPYDLADMTKSFVDISTNKDLCLRLKSQGLKQVSLYSWDKTAELTWETYKGIL